MRYILFLFLSATLLQGCSGTSSKRFYPEPIGPYYVGDPRNHPEPFMEPCRHVYVNIASNDINDSIRIELNNTILETDEFDLVVSMPDRDCICIKCNKKSKCHGE